MINKIQRLEPGIQIILAGDLNLDFRKNTPLSIRTLKTLKSLGMSEMGLDFPSHRLPFFKHLRQDNYQNLSDSEEDEGSNNTKTRRKRRRVKNPSDDPFHCSDRQHQIDHIFA